MIDHMHLRNTIIALVFPGLVSAFGTFLLKQFFMGLPKELEEAAILDGCTIGQTFLKIMMPLANSGMVALGIFTALFAFKDLMWPMIVNTDMNESTLSAALATIQGAISVNYPQVMAACVLAILPMLITYIIFQKQFIEGIATSGGKL
jgi:multiple sugar transport system permease protein